jgi:hypothetical protein
MSNVNIKISTPATYEALMEQNRRDGCLAEFLHAARQLADVYLGAYDPARDRLLVRVMTADGKLVMPLDGPAVFTPYPRQKRGRALPATLNSAGRPRVPSSTPSACRDRQEIRF